ncbi:MAG: YfhO family protein [Deltaproteobacteria bacterium]|nr:YfhO family protein [Deltaproteobacteria bacterium]
MAGAGALWLRFHAPPGAIGSVFPYDLVHYYLPMTGLVAERMGRGELPLWNPFSCSGIPLLATLQVGVFHPASWLALSLPAEQAIAIRALLETLLAGILAAALFRRWGGSWWAGALGGLLYVFACVLGEGFWPPSLSSLVWLPAILLCVDVLGRGWRVRWWILLVVCAALQILAGFPQLTVYGYLIVGPWALALLVEQRVRHGVRWGVLAARAAALALAMGLAPGVAAVQILPTLELVRESQRTSALSAAQVHYRRGETPLTPLGALANAVDPGPKLVSLGYGTGAGYLGTATLLLLVLGLAAEARRVRAWLLLGLGTLALVLSGGFLGPAPGLYARFAALPVVGLFRDPERLRLIPLFAALSLAVIGFGHLARGLATLPGRRRSIALGGVVAAAALVAAIGAPGAAARAAGGATLILLAARWRHAPRLRAAALAALLAGIGADLLLATQPDVGSLRDVPAAWSRNLSAGGRVFVDPARAATLAREAGTSRVALPNLRPELAGGPAGHLYRVSCLEPLAPRQWPALHERITGRAPIAGTLGGLPLERSDRFLDLAGAGLVAFAEVGPDASRAPAPGVGIAPERDLPPGMATRVVPNAGALPRARLVSEARVLAPDAMLATLVDGGLDFRRTVWLERMPAAAGPGSPGAAPVGSAEIRVYEPERVTVAVRSDREAFLVLSDTYFPGWVARVGGEPVEILRAYGLYRAVPVPAGEHLVEFTYRPASLVTGAWLSLLSLAALATVALAARRGRPRARSPQGGRARQVAGAER